MPKAIADHWETWGAVRPPDPVCLDQLILDEGYTDSAAKTFLEVYDETVAFAGLSDSDTLDGVTEEPEKMQHPPQQEIEALRQLLPKTAPKAGEPPVVALRGEFLEVSAFVDLKGARRLVKAILANITVLEDDDAEDDD